MKHVFVLGCERSGSTWLANLLDAHPQVELLMEPFAAYAGLFPGVPGRLVSVARPDAALVEALRSGMERVTAHKYPLLYRRGRPTALEAVDREIARGLRVAAQRLRVPVPRWIARYELLNLNASAVARGLRARKARSPSVRVIKELRLNLAVRLLVESFDDLRIIAIVRHPVAQVASMSRWIERGHLRELAGSLPSFRAALATPGPLRAYAPLLEGSEGPVEVLASYWVASYGTLLADLRESGCAYRLLRHEALCSEPGLRTRELLRFCTLPDSPEVARYLAASSATEAGEPGPLDTSRCSVTAPRRGLAVASDAVREGVRAVADRARKAGLLDTELEAYLA